jgi:hypothetical protein
MTLLELLARSRWGLEGLLDWQVNQRTAARILHRPVESVVVAGLALHFLHGLLLGIAFVLALPLFSAELPFWISGPAFGLVLFALALANYRFALGSATWSRELGSVAVTVAFLTHLTYGTVLALGTIWP